MDNVKVVGKCSICGGPVVLPSVIWMVGRVLPKCEKCGAVKDETANLPTIPMKPRVGPGYRLLHEGPHQLSSSAANSQQGRPWWSNSTSARSS